MSTLAYTGSYRCGCIVSVAVLSPDHASETARDAHEWVEQGLTLELRPLDEVKADPAFMRECGALEHEAVPA